MEVGNVGGWRLGWWRMAVGVGRVQSHQPEAEAGFGSGGPRRGESEVELELILTPCQRMELGTEENGGWREPGSEPAAGS
jgi:hypothetical protein